MLLWYFFIVYSIDLIRYAVVSIPSSSSSYNTQIDSIHALFIQSLPSFLSSRRHDLNCVNNQPYITLFMASHENDTEQCPWAGSR